MPHEQDFFSHHLGGLKGPQNLFEVEKFFPPAVMHAVQTDVERLPRKDFRALRISEFSGLRLKTSDPFE